MVLNFDIIGVWLLVFMTLCILSYLYGDNPFYKISEHIFVGVSAGYVFALVWWDQIWPNLFGRLFPEYVGAGFDFSPIYKATDIAIAKPFVAKPVVLVATFSQADPL